VHLLSCTGCVLLLQRLGVGGPRVLLPLVLPPRVRWTGCGASWREHWLLLLLLHPAV